ncbi:funZ protein [Mesorhizobium sp. LNJC399B00]|uniref:cold shock domain-containing protein n=1 Tax=unclassified Mesorhizobium TaxID=325217 RepID=UPI0003CE931A|nr:MULTISPECIES: cold shock domain-containing protein [unclassified Mesorhizobium]ESY07504.1 funZ protein [Mesorhizobium sp. LNJC399B00]WJI70808.1 cold shock domain-containing protein [Mesorhizobium sp. C399B]
MTRYKPFVDLNVGFSNAENYRRRENKALLSRYFVGDDFLDKIINPNTYYIIGEKGTGKTAYATYLANTIYKNNKVSTFDVRQTEYQKFIEIKRQGNLPLSQYTEVWRTILLMASATSVISHSGTPEFLQRFTKLGSLKKAIDAFYENAFAPEIVKMLTFVESGEVASSLLAKYSNIEAGFSSKGGHQATDSSSVFQTNLLQIRKAFESALSAVKLDNNIIIFIDGIDVRPADIAYTDYFECVRGLTEAVWSINNDFLANIKDTKGRIRVVLLARPDIFLRTGLHNINTKLRDNSVFLNWMTTYKDYRSSLMFKVADRLLSIQQDEPPTKLGQAWDHYFPFFAENVKADSISGEKGVNSFLSFLRFSYYRPRDINSMIAAIQEILKKKELASEYVSADDFNDSSFRDAHAEYLLGEIRDQLLFYYSQDEYDTFLEFFLHLRGKSKFTYDEYVAAFNEFIEQCAASGKRLPQIFENDTVFLQFLYDQNVICYKERDIDKKQGSEIFIRWCFRERTLANMAPKVRTGMEYEIFYGLSKALNVGRPIRVKTARKHRHIGTVIAVDIEKGFGFIRGGEKQIEYYFRTLEFPGKPYLRISDKVSFEVSTKYGKPRASTIQRER